MEKPLGIVATAAFVLALGALPPTLATVALGRRAKPPVHVPRPSILERRHERTEGREKSCKPGRVASCAECGQSGACTANGESFLCGCR